jgi:hypothetical protein
MAPRLVHHLDGHDLLDVGFREDASCVRDRTAARNLALLRKIALNLVRADGSLKASLKGKRKSAGWDDTAMAALIAGCSHASALAARPGGGHERCSWIECRGERRSYPLPALRSTQQILPADRRRLLLLRRTITVLGILEAA